MGSFGDGIEGRFMAISARGEKDGKSMNDAVVRKLHVYSLYTSQTQPCHKKPLWRNFVFSDIRGLRVRVSAGVSFVHFMLPYLISRLLWRRRMGLW